MVDQEQVEGFVQATFENSWEAFKADIVLYILAGLLAAVIGGLSLGLLFGPALLGLIEVVRKRLRGQEATATDVFAGFQRFGPAFVLGLVLGLAVIVGSLLCVLPGLAVAWVAMFAFQAMTYEKTGVTDSIKRSYELARAHLGPTLVLFLLLAVINSVAGAVALGSLFAFPFGVVALNVGFEKLTGAR